MLLGFECAVRHLYVCRSKVIQVAHTEGVPSADIRLQCLCRAASRVRTRQAWHAAVRHTGLLFQLPTPLSPPAHSPPAAATATPSTVDPPPGEGSNGVGAPDTSRAEGSEEEGGAACLEAAAAELPYPQLAQSVSSASFAPAAHLAEHYSPPGGAHAL